MSTAKRKLRRKLAREQHAIGRRLAEAVAPNGGDPVLGQANIGYELSERTKGTAHGGMGMIARVVADVGLAAEVDASVHVLAQHRPYHESDHVLNLAFNALCEGTALDDLARDGRHLKGEPVLAGALVEGALDEEVDPDVDGDQQQGDDGKTQRGVVVLEGEHRREA